MPVSTIKSATEGQLVWSTLILSNTITKLYSEKLIIVHNLESFEVLDAQNGNFIRSVNFSFYKKITPFLGPLCAVLDAAFGESYFVDMKTGLIYNASQCLSSIPIEDSEEHMPLTLYERKSPFCSTEDLESMRSRYHISSTVLCRMGLTEAGLFEAYML
ncbi:hypothetical protein BDF19DRAFT_419332 [Syncephalis fuscata]|nr:hypothetical protein BDF19DRAFT_419332 [Syncephalis fuscata]